MPKLSVIIIARNEERDLPGCLESIRSIADEIIVVDSGSIDGTREVARRFGAKVIERAWAGYGPQKQFALEQATGDWVLNIDADERVTPALAEEITSFIKTSAANGAEIPFQVYFLGRRLRFGGCARERHVRLFRRSEARYAGKAIHEGITVNPPIEFLSAPVRHESYADLAEYLEKCREYTGLIAREKYARGDRFAVWHHGWLPWEFVIRYVVKLGFLDGRAGFVYAALSAYYAWLKHVRLLDFER